MSEYSERSFEPVWSTQFRAGKRTYFFDVKATAADEYFLCVTESKRHMGRDGRFVYDKHKIFVYREDLDNFEQALLETLAFIRQHKGADYGQPRPKHEFPSNEQPTEGQAGPGNVSFEDLD